MKRRILYIIYIVSVLLGLFVLFPGMFHGDETIEADVIENRDDMDYAKQLDDYISRNFAFRKGVIAAYTSLQQRFFLSSPVKDVIIGENGYLFYEDTVEDYSGLNRLNDRELYNVKKTLELMGESVADEGGRFLFVIAPNKNSLYDYMPYNYRKSTEQSNAERLLSCLEGVEAVNLFELFNGKEEELYFKTDTHWNDEGAYYVYEAVQRVLGQEYIGFLEREYTAEKTLVGDLANMLYPGTAATEYKLVFEEKYTYEFLTKTRSFEQNYIETTCDGKEDSLLMFRDSFANNLAEYFCETYGYAIFDKSLPYDLTQMETYKSNVVIVELAERNLREYIEMAPIMAAPQRENVTGEAVDDLCEAFSVEEGEYVRITGALNNKYTCPQTEIYVRVNGALYELTPITAEGNLYGFEGYVEVVGDLTRVSIVAVTEDTAWEQLCFE